MKLIKIGKDTKCDLVLKSDYVSALHAELTILDDGQMFIEDKGSTNGTFIGKKKLEKGQEYPVQFGDSITFADTPLVWAQVPQKENLSAYKAVYNIGTNFRNEILLNNQTVSRYHASLRIGKNGKAYIRDNKSVNKTKLNGVPIEANKDIPIKRSDNIVCGTEDITERIKNLIPASNFKKIGIITGAIAAVAILACVIIMKLIPDPTPDPRALRDAVVYVRASYHYIVKFKDNPMPDSWDGKIEDIASDQPYSATAFFLDRNGFMGTNRHVAVPWEYRTEEDESKLRGLVEERLNLCAKAWMSQAGFQVTVKDEEELDKIKAFPETPLFKSIYKHLLNSKDPYTELIKVLDRIKKSDYDISGEIDDITVGYAGRYYTHTDEFQRCNVICDSQNKDIDVAILQLNNKKTPDEIKYVFSPDKFFTGTLVPLQDELVTIGYPLGLLMGKDDTKKSIEPTIRETKCSKEPSKYVFEFQSNSIAGSSGSPVFNKKGQLVGVLDAAYQIAGGPSTAVHAKYLKKLYDEEVK